MRNLTIYSKNCRPFKCLDNQLLDLVRQSQVLCTVNSNNYDVYFMVDGELFIVPHNDEPARAPVKVTDSTNFVSLEFCSITQQLYCACENGDVLTVDVDGDVLGTELVAQVSGGLECARLSPDQEILVLVTKTGTVVSMVSEFQVLSETNLYSSDFGQKQFVTIGWGKKETQFHGSEGKAAAKLKPIIHIEESEAVRLVPAITWRGDGLYFAVSFVNRENKARQFKVFSREGTLQYTCELCNGLEEFLSWEPSGGLIAATQKLANKYVVALFEKNGLRHRDFTLPFQTNEITIRNLFWSPNSDILTIWCERTDHKPFLQLWTQNNYHWYLKQTITFSGENALIYATWSTTARSGMELILITSQELLTYSFHWTVNQSIGKTVEDKAVVGVIDGRKALLTSFRGGIIPPPMAHQEIKTDAPVNAIVFAPEVTNGESWVNSNAFFSLLENENLVFFECKSDSDTLEYCQVASCEIKWVMPEFDSIPLSHEMSHFLWYKENIILCCLTADANCFLCVLELNSAKLAEQNCITVRETHVMDGAIEHMVPSADAETVYIVVEGSVLKYTENMGLGRTGIKLQQVCYQVNTVRIGKKDVLLALSHRNCLSVDGKEIANNITSMYVHSDFILLTTLQHTLICAPADESGIERLIKQDLTVKPWADGFNEKVFAVVGLNVRRVERGSLLITSIAKDSNTVLQMPRGNLECIQPRALSLHIIGSLLSNCEYLTAFTLMRKQRINLNLIYDHNPALFIANSYEFVAGIGKPSWLSLFLTELQNEDVTETVYANCYIKDSGKASTVPKNDIPKNKVEYVCDLLRDIMEKRSDANDFIQPILISLVKSDKRRGLEAALGKVRRLKDSEKTSESAECVCAEKALRYLLYLVDVNTLFDTALGMYDIEFALFLASKSQKDPKEYLPFLSDLERLDTIYMKYSIDMHLKRFKSALCHISLDRSRFYECMTLVRNHHLYATALKLYFGCSEEYKEISCAYGEHLLNKHKYQEAGIMFCKGGDLKNALYSYKKANDWQEAIVVAHQMKLSVTEMHSLYRELTVRLKEDRRYEEAARIFMNYLHDPEEAVSALCHDKKWKDARRIAYDIQRLDLIDTHIEPSVYKHVDHILLQITEDEGNFEKHRSRLATLRNEMMTKKALTYDNIIDDDIQKGGINDMLSETSSIAGSVTSQKSRYSTASGRSYRSSKNRRKQERKFLSLKEGSAFEDLGLLRALHEIITQAYKRMDEVYLVLEMMMLLDGEQSAETLQTSANNFLRMIERSKSQIWDKTAPTSLSHVDDASAGQFPEIQKLIGQQFMHPPDSVLLNPPQWDIF